MPSTPSPEFDLEDTADEDYDDQEEDYEDYGEHSNSPLAVSASAI